ncbi:MAG: fibronectin type III domain-containing protein [Sediminibacterium sp.]|nr:fibronectin type III domain-containing protein [Sediminibacterium sp.]
MWFAGNKLYLGAFNQDQLINFGDADTVLKNGLNEWNKYSLFYNASTKTYYAYINGVLKGTATVATDKYVAPLISNFLANNSYGDAITDGYYREFKIYKNLSYTDFISNLPYNIVPNISDKSLYYYLPLSININNKSFIGNATISNNTELENRALMYNPNALNNNAILVTANEEAFYYGDSNNQIITGEFADQASRIRFRYTNGQIKDTILPVLASQNFSWQIRGNNISGKFKVFNSISAQNADSINILLAPSKLKYASNNRVYSIVAGNSGTPTYIGTDTVLFSIDSGNVAGIIIHATTGLISWSNAIPAGLTKIRVLASNAGGTTNITYIANFQDTLKGFSYTPDSIQASGNNADSLPFLPTFTKGTGAAFTILNPIEGFSIDENNGKIYWTNTVANGVYKIRVEANNIYNTPLIDTITIKLTNLPPSNIQYVKDTMVFSQGVHLKTVIPSVNTGGLPTIFAINNITPNGGNFSIDSLTGEIKWVPTTVGTYTIIVVATNSLGSVTKTIQITITSAGNIAVDYNNAALTLGIKILGNNSKNRVELPNIDLRGAGGYTIETWARIIDANNVGLWRRIFDVGTGQNYEGVILGFPTSTAFGLHASTVEDYTFDFPPNFSALNWNHYAVTVRDSVRLYINGVLIGTQRSNNPTVIFNKNYLNYSNWVIDEPSYNVYQETRVWKYARSGDEIAQNYQGSVPDEAIGLYYYLPFKQAGYLPGSIINPTNFVLDPTLPLFIGNPSYTSKIANAAVKSSITDSSKIVAVIPNYLVATVLNTNQVSDLIPYYKIDSTRQKIQGNFADTLLAGEQLQYSIDTGRIWKNIGFVKNNNFSQTLDTSFKYGLIKIRSVINNVATSRVFNDIDVLVFPNPPTGARATARNDGTVTLQFTPPLIKSAITGYKIYTSAGVLLATATQSPVIITGLNNGQTYQFGVTTINSRGESKLSTLSSPITVVNNILQVTTYTNTIAGVSITPTTNVTAYTNFRVTYQVNAGYKLDSIIINNVKNVDSTTGYTFVNINTINSVKVYASKIPFRITITQNSGGVVTPNLSTITTYYGDTLTIQISPNNRYRVDSVFINGAYREDAKNGFTFYNIQENNTVRVVFKEIIYNKITIEIVGKGKTTVTGGMVEVEQGTSYRVEYRADEGNYLVSVFVDEVLTNDSVSGYTINAITSDVKIRLVFKIQTFTITTSVLNGEIQPTGESTYNYGSSLTVRFSPKDETYVLDSLIVDGELQYNPEIDSFTFTDIKANHTIRAIFNLKSEVRFTIVIRSNTGGVVSPSVNQLVSYGGSLRVSWVINPGYVLDSLLIGGKNNTDSVNGYTFTDVRGQQSIYIKFKLRTFTIISSAGLHGSINPLGISIVNYGASKTFILLPNAGYETDSLYINGSIVSKPADNIYTFNNVLTNKTIYVTFKVVTINPTPCTGTKQTPNIVRVTDALKSDITTFATQRWYLAGTIKDSTTNNTYTPTDAGVYTLLGVDATGCESNISKKYYYSKSCIIPTGRLGNGANIQTDIVGNANIMVIKWCTDLIQGEVRVQVLDISGEQIEDKKIPASFGTYILNKQQIQSKKFIIKVIDNNGEIIQISDVVNN